MKSDLGGRIKVHIPGQFVTCTTAGLDEPLTRQFKIHLGMRATKLGRDAGKFSSDRAIAEYAGEIWNVQPSPVR